jgi:hypothetical protein
MRYTGGEFVVGYLIRRGVPCMAGIPGHGCLALVKPHPRRPRSPSGRPGSTGCGRCGGLVTGWWDVPVPDYLEDRRAKYLSERETEYLGPGGAG